MSFFIEFENLFRYKLFLFIGIILCCLCRCTSQSKLIASRDLAFLKTESKIAIPTNSIFFGIINDHVNDYFVFIDKDLGAISLRSIKDSSVLQVDLNRSFNKEVLKDFAIQDLCLINRDSIIIVMDEKIIGITNNTLFLNISNEFISNYKFKTVFSGLSEVSHLEYDRANRIIYGRSIPILYRFKKDFWKQNILGVLHLDSQKLESLPIFFPDFFLNQYVGDVEQPQIYLRDHKLWVFFPPCEDYLNYYYNSKQIEQYKFPKSVFSSHDQKYFKWGQEIHIKKRLDNLVENGIYDNVIFLPEGKGYCRFFRRGVPLKNPDGTFNSKMDKRISMMVISAENNLIDEYVFPEGGVYNTYVCFTSQNKLYINNQFKDVQNPGYIHFDAIELP